MKRLDTDDKSVFRFDKFLHELSSELLQLLS